MKNLKWLLVLSILFLSVLILVGCGGDSTGTVTTNGDFSTSPTLPPIPEWPDWDPNSATDVPVGTAVGYVLSRTDGGVDINNGLAAFQITDNPNLANYTPVENAVVALVDDASVTATTDSVGKFILHNVPYSQIGDLSAVTVVGDTDNIVTNALYVPIQITVIVNPQGTVADIVEVRVVPESATLYTGQAYQFKVYCKDNQNNLVNPAEFIWEVSGGIGVIDQYGILLVSENTGLGTVTVKVGEQLASVEVTVVERPSTGSISGKVTYSDGSPATIKLTIQGMVGFVSPDINGQYSIEQISAGTQTIIATYNETEIWSGEVNVNVSANTNFDILLPFDPISPNITSLTPEAGVEDTPVIITGSHFGIEQGNSSIAFNGINAVVDSWSNSSIVAHVPQGFSDGNVVVSVNGVNSNAEAFYLFDFRYIVFRRGIPFDDHYPQVYDISTLNVLDISDINNEVAGSYPDISGNGRYVTYIVSGVGLRIYDRDVSSFVDPSGITAVGYPSLNFDGNYISFCKDNDISLYDRINSNYLDLTNLNSSVGDLEPSLSPDGRYISFTSNRLVGGEHQEYNIYLYDRISASLINLPDLNSLVWDRNSSVSSDARYIVFESTRLLSGTTVIYLYDRNSSSLVSLPGLRGEAINDYSPSISSNGNYIVFQSNRTGSDDIYIYSRITSTLISLPNLNSDVLAEIDPAI